MARHYPEPPPGDEPAGVPVSRASLREAAGIFAYLLPYRRKFAAGLGALWASSLLALAFPYLAGSLVDGVVAGRSDNVTPVMLALLAALALQAFFLYWKAVWLAEVSERSLADLRRDTYARLVRLPMAFFGQRRVGELAGRLAADLTHVHDTLVWSLPALLRQLTILAGGVVLLAFTSGRLTLAMLLIVPPLIGLAVFFGRKIRRVWREAQDRLADSNVIVEETLQGIVNVKAFTGESYEQERYRSSLEAYVRTVLRGARYRGALVSFVVFVLFGGVVAVLWYGIVLVRTGELSAGELTRFMLYTMFVGGALGSFAELYSQLQKTLGASHRVRELLHETPEPVDVPAPEKGTVPLPQGDSPLFRGPRLRGDVAFEQVTFSYPARKEVMVLRGLSLAARAGERVALVGPSGAGKSTTVSLLLRFYEPDGGRILLDGRDAHDYALPELRGQMAMVPQDVLLFGGTIAANIAYGKPGCSAAEIEEAARRAHAHEFIRTFPQGYQTLVGERGIKLSGGQRQRVAIARAVLKDPAILILDEATSSLDSESESLVQQALDELMRGRTSIIIAHRLATVRKADRIFVIQEGRVVEAGTHAELIAKPGGLYRTLSELQLDLR